MSNIECTKGVIRISTDILLRDILPLINANDIRLLNEDGDEIMCITQGYLIDSLSYELLCKRVTAIWHEECVLNTVNIQISKSVNTEELKIVKRTIKLDVIDELVIDIINTGRQQKKEYEEGH